MKVGFIGVGVVGGAIKKAVETIGVTVKAYDKFKPELGEFKDVLSCDMIFVSVPTATLSSGIQDKIPLIEVCIRLMDNNYKGIVVVKCTVLPGTCEWLTHQYSLNIVHSPEFLTAANAYQDFIKQKAVITGGKPEHTSPVVDLMHKISPDAMLVAYTDTKTSEMIKYMHNLFLATKVSFCNEIAEMCAHLGVHYQDVRTGTIVVGGIGIGHTAVPGPDGKPGYGGMCFPKDTKAFLHFAESNNVPMQVLEGTVVSNDMRRG